MILPTKHLSPDRAIISVASEIFQLIDKRSTVSSLWNEFQNKCSISGRHSDVPYDWFILSLDFLFMIGAIEENEGKLARSGS